VCTSINNEDELQTGIDMLRDLIPCTPLVGVMPTVDLEEVPLKFTFLWQTLLVLRSKASIFCEHNFVSTWPAMVMVDLYL
jgi:hypothetical protein